MAALAVVCEISPLPIELYLIPHSHTDAGWSKTKDEYFESTVKEILNKLIAVMETDQTTVFNWAETHFLAQWWDQATEEQRTSLSSLAKSGRFGVMGGGWVQHDENLPNYQDILLQLQTGIDWLQYHLGVTPKVGWQIDPYGHSSNTPWIYAFMGYESIVLNRVGTTIEYEMRKSKSSEFVWLDMPHIHHKEKDFDIFAHILVNSEYMAPSEFRY